MRKETTKLLSELVEKLINPHNDPRIYWAKEVTFDHYTAHAIRVDYMKFKPVNNTVSGIEKGDFYCYEVKSSMNYPRPCGSQTVPWTGFPVIAAARQP